MIITLKEGDIEYSVDFGNWLYADYLSLRDVDKELETYLEYFRYEILEHFSTWREKRKQKEGEQNGDT